MNKSIIALFSIFAVLFTAPFATAQGDIKIVTVSMERLFDGYHKSAEFRNRMNSVRTEAQTELESRRNAFQQRIAAFEERREGLDNPLLSDDRRADLQRELQREIEQLRAAEQELNRWQQARMNQINQSEQNLRSELIREIREAVIAAAATEGATVVLDTSDVMGVGVATVVFSKPELDITDRVLRQINRNAPGL
ncbi:MAG: OmpH family outer membrane protein [Verrucomicrobia bacterium]|nr:OmpH family outer membrane protein [Verrucomicrobiota bacterium]